MVSLIESPIPFLCEAGMTTNTDNRRRAQWGWYWFDFGNSAYAAVILLAVYSAFFRATVVGGASGSRLWGLSLGTCIDCSLRWLIPILGTVADHSAPKRFPLRFSALGGGYRPAVLRRRPAMCCWGCCSLHPGVKSRYRGDRCSGTACLLDVAGREIRAVSATGGVRLV